MSRPRPRLTLHELEGRALPSVGVEGLIAVGADAGGLPEVKLLNADGSVRGSFLAYDESFRGGVRVSVGDVTGDGKPDIVTAPGVGGGPVVKVFDGVTGNEVASFFAYDPNFRGGVSLDVGVLNGREVIVTGPGPSGAPVVKVFDGPTQKELLRFNAYDPGFLGGVSVAVGNVLAGGVGQVVTGPGPGGGPHVKVFDGKTGAERAGFFAYAPTFTGGVSVAAGNVANLGGRAAVVTGAGPGGGPQVNVIDAATGKVVQSQFAFDAGFTGGVNVGVIRGGPGQTDRLITAAGPTGGPQVNVYDHWNGNNVYGPGYGGLGYGAFGAGRSFFAFPSYFAGGLGFGTGYGLYGGYAPLFRPYYGGALFYNNYSAPSYIVNNSYVNPAAFDYAPSVSPSFLDNGPAFNTDPSSIVPDTIPYIQDNAGDFSPISDPGYYDPGYFDPGFSDFGGFGDFGGGFGDGF